MIKLSNASSDIETMMKDPDSKRNDTATVLSMTHENHPSTYTSFLFYNTEKV